MPTTGANQLWKSQTTEREIEAEAEFIDSAYNARVASISHFAEHVDDLIDHVQGESRRSAEMGPTNP